jgi:hypothetical protein
MGNFKKGFIHILYKYIFNILLVINMVNLDGMNFFELKIHWIQMMSLQICNFHCTCQHNWLILWLRCPLTWYELSLTIVQHVKRDYDSAYKVCNDGSPSRRKPSSIKPLCNTFANNCGDMFANPLHAKS